VNQGKGNLSKARHVYDPSYQYICTDSVSTKAGGGGLIISYCIIRYCTDNETLVQRCKAMRSVNIIKYSIKI